MSKTCRGQVRNRKSRGHVADLIDLSNTDFFRFYFCLPFFILPISTYYAFANNDNRRKALCFLLVRLSVRPSVRPSVDR